VSVSRIYLIGFMGAGKSTVGRFLAAKLGWNFIDLDDEIERRERRPIAEIFRQDGEPRFRELERLCLKELSSSPKTVIALGGGTFIDPENRDLATRTGLTIWLKVSFDKLVHRVRIDGSRPKFVDTEQTKRLYQTREPFYALAKVHVSTEEGTAETTVDEIIEVIENV